MTTSKDAVPTVLQIKLTSQQHHAFATCAKTCGLDLEIWILQCAEVKAAAVIDAMQAPQRKERQSRKKQRPRSRAERDDAEETEETEAEGSGPGPESSVSGHACPVSGEPAQSPTMEAARSYNARFRRKPGEARTATGRKGLILNMRSRLETTQDKDPTSRPSSLTKKLSEEQKDKTSQGASRDENSWPFELPTQLAGKNNENADGSLIQRAIDNQAVEEGIRRRLEDERASWEAKCNDARGQAVILERQLDAALGHVAILERQPRSLPMWVSGSAILVLGAPGVRDPEHLCADYDPGPEGPGRCAGDGHYLCGGCREHNAPPNKETQE